MSDVLPADDKTIERFFAGEGLDAGVDLDFVRSLVARIRHEEANARNLEARIGAINAGLRAIVRDVPSQEPTRPRAMNVDAAEAYGYASALHDVAGMIRSALTLQADLRELYAAWWEGLRVSGEIPEHLTRAAFSAGYRAACGQAKEIGT